MSRFSKSLYNVINKEKYIGKKTPICRSSWETKMCMFFDHHPSVMQWASEPIMIRYHDPLTNKLRNYIPDFFVNYKDKNGVNHAEIVEVKPSSQSGLKATKSRTDKAQVIKNMAKWSAAQAYCAKNGLVFRVVTENEIFKGTK
jgi:hypothetical protein